VNFNANIHIFLNLMAVFMGNDSTGVSYLALKLNFVGQKNVFADKYRSA
jgi:predicted ATPase